MVYVVQEQAGKNILPAMKFGELESLLPQNYQITLMPEEAIKLIGTKLKTFCSDDYLLLIGDPVAIAIATYMAAKTNQGGVKVLKWDRQQSMYYSVFLDFNCFEINYNRKK